MQEFLLKIDVPAAIFVVFFDFRAAKIPSADPLIVGRWINTANPQWHKAYYDDYNVGRDGSLLTIPFYMAFLLSEI